MITAPADGGTVIVSEKETEVGTEEEIVTEIEIEGMKETETETEIVTTTVTEKMSKLLLQAVIRKCL